MPEGKEDRTGERIRSSSFCLCGMELLGGGEEGEAIQERGEVGEGERGEVGRREGQLSTPL